MLNLLIANNEVSNVNVLEPVKSPILSVLDQSAAHESRSDKYSVVQTGKMIEILEKAGFEAKLVQEEKSRKGYKGFGTHLVAFDHPEITLGNAELDKEMRPRIYFKNSYHGRSMAEFYIGLIRFVCLNGMVLGDIFGSIKVKHIGLNLNDMEQAIDNMKKLYSDDVAPLVQSLRTTQISKDQQVAFAEAALRERLRLNKGFIRGEHEKLLICNRVEDSEPTLWHTLQRVQENMGLNYRRSDLNVDCQFEVRNEDGTTNSYERRLSSLRNIKEVTHMNKFLFDEITKCLPPKSDSIAEAIAA